GGSQKQAQGARRDRQVEALITSPPSGRVSRRRLRLRRTGQQAKQKTDRVVGRLRRRRVERGDRGSARATNAEGGFFGRDSRTPPEEEPFRAVACRSLASPASSPFRGPLGPGSKPGGL